MQQKHLKRKGLTLLEVIISIAVYAVLALLLAEIMTLVNSTIRSTEQLNNRLNYEAKFADNLLTGDALHTFDKEQVGVKIQYDVTGKTVSAGGQVTAVNSNHTLSQFKHVDLKADEITADYDETSLGTHYHDNTNYRFMRFDKTKIDKSKPSDMFTVTLWLDIPEDIRNDVTQIVVNGNFVGGVTSKNLTMSDFAVDTNGWYSTDLRMDASATLDADGEPIKETVYDTITVTFYRGHTVGYNTGKTLSLKATDKYDEFSIKYPLSQKQGSEMNYYKGYNIIYRNNTVATPSDLTDAQRNDHDIPKEMEIAY